MSKIVNNLTFSHIGYKVELTAQYVLLIKYPRHVTSDDTTKNLMRKHVMSPTKFTMKQTTNEHFNISDVSQHVKHQLPITDSAGVTKPELIILTIHLTVGLTAHMQWCVWYNSARYDRNLLTNDRIYNLHA